MHYAFDRWLERDDLLRQVLQDRAERPAPAHQHHLVRWAKRKYKRLRSYKKVRKWWEGADREAATPVRALDMVKYSL